jgi:hypothetical protein
MKAGCADPSNASYMHREADRWRTVIKSANIRMQ